MVNVMRSCLNSRTCETTCPSWLVRLTDQTPCNASRLMRVGTPCTGDGESQGRKCEREAGGSFHAAGVTKCPLCGKQCFRVAKAQPSSARRPASGSHFGQRHPTGRPGC